jgi:hypothetical protein
MNTNLELKTGNWLLVVGSHTSLPTILRMIGRLAETGPVRVVDNGFSFNPFIVRTGMHAGLNALQRIRVYKAYSCREMLSVLESLDSGPEPFVVLDFLATFFYFFEGFEQRKCLLSSCLAQLNRLVSGSSATRVAETAEGGRRPPRPASGLVSVHLPAVLSQAESELLGMVTRACSDTCHVERSAAAALPVRVY